MGEFSQISLPPHRLYITIKPMVHYCQTPMPVMGRPWSVLMNQTGLFYTVGCYKRVLQSLL